MVVKLKSDIKELDKEQSGDTMPTLSDKEWSLVIKHKESKKIHGGLLFCKTYNTGRLPEIECFNLIILFIFMVNMIYNINKKYLVSMLNEP